MYRKAKRDGNEQSVIGFNVCIQPLPKQRPRVVNGRAYTPSRTRDYENYIRKTASSVMLNKEPITEDVAVYLYFRRKGKRRADLDNLIKAIIDPLQEIVFINDSQIICLNSFVKYECENPGVDIIIKEL